MMDKHKEAFGKLLEIMDRLRAECPWDKVQTLESLRTLTIEESYMAMLKFIEGYYYRLNQPDLLAMLLGGFRLRTDGLAVDPAAWEDWLDAVNEVLNNQEED